MFEFSELSEVFKMIFIVGCMFYVQVLSVMSQPFEFSIKENQPNGTYLGQVGVDQDILGTLDLSQQAELRFKIFAQGNSWLDYFHVDAMTGVIRTAAVFDREQLCQNVDSECIVDLDIAIHSETFLRLIRVKVHVLDINDNAPEFPERTLTIQIPESASVNFSVPISAASDTDTGENNGVKDYEIIPKGGLLGIDVVHNLDGTTDLGVIVRGNLDREKTPSYDLQILAKDGGFPSKTGTLFLTVEILDVNDHAPVFTNTPYIANITEDSPVNSPVMIVTASDLDAGENSEIRFQLSSRSLAKFPDVFDIDTVSGEIRIVSSLDYESVKVYRVVVEAFDLGSPRLTSQTLLIVNVQDVNDNAPDVNFNFLSGKNYAEMVENAEIDDFVAHVSVVDKDEGENAFVNCETDSERFKTDRLYDSEFQILLNSSLDYEELKEVNITVTCTDRGKQSLSQSRTFRLDLLDFNDNRPIFTQSSYRASVPENAQPGQQVVRVEATDLDSFQNGDVRYWLFGENRDVFALDETSGILILNQPLDFENVSKVTVYIEARDGGSPALVSTTAVDILVTDVNDEPPSFSEPFYAFDVPEESLADRFVGQVIAIDGDKSFGGKTRCKLIGPPSIMTTFEVTPNGTIFTTRKIDREENEEFVITVVAEDVNDPSQTSSVEVTISIVDTNDNNPVITFPDNLNNTVVIHSHEQNTMIPFTSIIAQDVDDGENSALRYSLINEEVEKIFTISESNGSLWLLHTQQVEERETYSIQILVKDGGFPSLEASARLFVILEPSPVSSTDLLANTNVMIVIIVISITIVLSIVISIGICFVRKTSNDLTKSGGITYSISVNQAPVPDNIMDFTLDDDVFEDDIEKIQYHNKNNIFKEDVNSKPEKLNVSSEALSQDELFKTKTSQRLDLSPTPIDIFRLRHDAEKEAWLQQLRNSEAIGRTSSTNSRYGVVSLSNMSLDTLTSDSGKGGSEQDSREQEHEERQKPGFESDYMDMHRSHKRSTDSEDFGENIHSDYESYLTSRGMLPVHTPTFNRTGYFKGSNSEYETSENSSRLNRGILKSSGYRPNSVNGEIALQITPRVKFNQRLPSDDKTVSILNNSNSLYSVHALTNISNMPTSDSTKSRRPPSGSESEEDYETTTSGSYAVDLRDFVEFEDAGILPAEFSV